MIAIRHSRADFGAGSADEAEGVSAFAVLSDFAGDGSGLSGMSSFVTTFFTSLAWDFSFARFWRATSPSVCDAATRHRSSRAMGNRKSRRRMIVSLLSKQSFQRY